MSWVVFHLTLDWRHYTYLVLLEERAADVTVKRVGEVVAQVVQSLLQILRAFRVVYGHVEQVDEPTDNTVWYCKRFNLYIQVMLR